MPFGRGRGGQPGNKNALKHGFYSGAISAAMKNTLARALEDQDRTNLYQEVALARAHVFRLLQKDPTNHRVLRDFLNAITRMVAFNYQLTHNQEREMGSALETMLAQLLPEEHTYDPPD